MSIDTITYNNNPFMNVLTLKKGLTLKKDDTGKIIDCEITYPEYPQETTNVLVCKNSSIDCIEVLHGIPVNAYHILPCITDVKVFKDGTPTVVVYFADKTFEKAKLNDNDNFSLEQGISICITKKMLSKVTNGNGNSFYNKLIKHAMNVIKTNEKRIEAEKKEAELAERAKVRHQAKKAARHQKKAQKRRDFWIDVMTQANLRTAEALMQNTNNKIGGGN